MKPVVERITCKCPLYINSLDVNEGYTIKSLPELVNYLCYRDCTVAYEFMEQAVINCATELGCVYQDIYELEKDIHRYYI